MKINIAYEIDGSVLVARGAPKKDLEKLFGEDFTDQEYINFVWARSVPQNAVNAVILKDDDIPDSKVSRDLWSLEGTTIKIKEKNK